MRFASWNKLFSQSLKLYKVNFSASWLLKPGARRREDGNV